MGYYAEDELIRIFKEKRIDCVKQLEAMFKEIGYSTIAGEKVIASLKNSALSNNFDSNLAAVYISSLQSIENPCLIDDLNEVFEAAVLSKRFSDKFAKKANELYEVYSEVAMKNMYSGLRSIFTQKEGESVRYDGPNFEYYFNKYVITAVQSKNLTDEDLLIYLDALHKFAKENRNAETLAAVLDLFISHNLFSTKIIDKITTFISTLSGDVTRFINLKKRFDGIFEKQLPHANKEYFEKYLSVLIEFAKTGEELDVLFKVSELAIKKGFSKETVEKLCTVLIEHVKIVQADKNSPYLTKVITNEPILDPKTKKPTSKYREYKKVDLEDFGKYIENVIDDETTSEDMFLSYLDLLSRFGEKNGDMQNLAADINLMFFKLPGEDIAEYMSFLSEQLKKNKDISSISDATRKLSATDKFSMKNLQEVLNGKKIEEIEEINTDEQMQQYFALNQQKEYNKAFEVASSIMHGHKKWRNRKLDQNTLILINNYFWLCLNLKKYKEGKRYADSKIIQELLEDNPAAFHNTACIYVALGNFDKAIDQIKKAKEGGYSMDKITNDIDLKPIFDNPEFKKIISKK